jgi:hypothetical protein
LITKALGSVEITSNSKSTLSFDWKFVTLGWE